MGGILVQTPSGEPGVNSHVRHGFSKDEKFSRYNVANIIPEIEQINLGFLMMPYFDPVLTREQSRDVALVTYEIYQEMEMDDNFHELGSVMGWSYVQLLGKPFDKQYLRQKKMNKRGFL